MTNHVYDDNGLPCSPVSAMAAGVMLSHTPGPWVIEEFSAADYDGEDAATGIMAYADENGKEGAMVASVNRWSYGDDPATDESTANARLISAAPELLAACKELRDDLVKHARYGLNDAETAMLQRAEAAIAKAEATNPRSTQCSGTN